LKNSKQRSGFTLIELLVAMVILSVALLALAGLMVFTTQSNASGNHLTEASTFAQDIFERLRARPWTSMTGGADIVQVESEPGVFGQSYQRSWVVTPDAGGTLKEISVTMRWSDPTNHQITFRTAFVDPNS
jgi:prepilin-type N-terminal cleavage/methylation domain-containing protein